MISIPVHQLQQKTETGLEIKVFRPDDQRQYAPDWAGAHRDDHYIFFLLTKGAGTVKIELQEVSVGAGQVYYITPSQVHHRIEGKSAEGWFLAVETALIPPGLRAVFEDRITLQLPCTIGETSLKRYSTLLSLLHEECSGRVQDSFYLPVVHPLLQSFLAMAASDYSAVNNIQNLRSRSAELTHLFNKLLSSNIQHLRSPSAYAATLNVSLGHLNESVKKITGATVSYWIQQELISETKRLLYHTDRDVRQIAEQMGYPDYSYFSRVFRKAAGMSPTAFRKKYKKTAS